MATAEHGITSTPLDGVFDLDPQSTDLSALTAYGRFDSENCTSNGCGPAPHTTGCATPGDPGLSMRGNEAA